MKDYCNDFITYLDKIKRYSPNTVDAYRRDLLDFVDFFEGNLLEVTRSDILNYLKFQADLGMAVATTNRRLTSIKAFYKYLFVENLIPVNPAETVEASKLDKKLPTVLHLEDFNLLMKVVDNLRDKVVLEMLLATGLRRSELASLKISQINLREGLIKVNGKGNKERIIPLYDGIISRLKLYISQIKGAWLFPSPDNPQNHITPRSINYIVGKWASEVGLEDITPHAFRHSFGTFLYENGADIKTIQELLGHESIDTTNIYAQTSYKRNKIEYLKHHPLNIKD